MDLVAVSAYDVVSSKGAQSLLKQTLINMVHHNIHSPDHTLAIQVPKAPRFEFLYSFYFRRELDQTPQTQYCEED